MSTKGKALSSSSVVKNEATELKYLVRELKAQNSKLQRRVAKLEAESLTARNRIKALEKQKPPTPTKPISEIEAARRIAFLLNKGGLDIHGNPVTKGPPNVIIWFMSQRHRERNVHCNPQTPLKHRPSTTVNSWGRFKIRKAMRRSPSPRRRCARRVARRWLFNGSRMDRAKGLES